MTEPSFGAPPPSAAAGGGPSGPRASFGTRFLAALIDAVLVGVVEGVLFGIGGRAAGQGIGGLVGLVYSVYFHGSPSGQTVGKHVMNIRVIDFNTGGPLGYGKAFIRWLCSLLSGIVCLLGYLWMLWDPEKQTWHDKLAGTVVVPTSAYPVAAWPG
jgi:uncharacterized RDD family membrane protein YckC